MINKKLKEIVEVDTISQDSTWHDIAEEISKITQDDELVVDMNDVKVNEPWKFQSFTEVLKNNKCTLLFTDENDLVKRIKINCLINGFDPERVINIDIDKPKEKTAEEIKIEKNGKEMTEWFKLEDDTYKLDFTGHYTQIYNIETIDFLEKAIEILNKNTKIKKFEIEFDVIDMQNNVINKVAKLMANYYSKGITVDINSNVPEVTSKIKLYIHKLKVGDISDEKREEIIRNNIPLNTPGILKRYRKSRAKDDFGRYGNGEGVSARIAIYRGLVEKDGRVYASIDNYDKNYFYTKQHWLVDNDNEELDNLVMDSNLIPLEDIGFWDYFIGSTYHFLEPIQQTLDESQKVIVGLNENGGNISKTCTIAERMQAVFDDWGVEYNVNELNKYIKKTKEHLKI